MKTVVPFSLVLFLASVFALGPFSIDSYLPALSYIGQDLHVDTAKVALTVSIYVFTMAIGQLIGGPLSDHAGRRFTILLGLVLFIFGTLAISQTETLYHLYFWRVIQALGGGIAYVCVPAIIRDVAKGAEAAKLFTLIGLVMLIAPSIAPSIGTVILTLSDWRCIFIFVAIFATIVGLSALVVIPKKVTVAKEPHIGILNGFIKIFKTREARRFLIIQAATYSVLMVFLTNSSMIYIEHYGLSEALFSTLFMINTAGSIIVNRINGYLLNYHTPEKLLKFFVGLQFFGGSILLFSQIFMPASVIFTVVGFAIMLSAMGGIVGNSNACFMTFFPNRAGTAAAFLGASQSFISAIMAALSTLLLASGLWALVLMLLGISAIAMAYACCDKEWVSVNSSI